MSVPNCKYCGLPTKPSIYSLHCERETAPATRCSYCGEGADPAANITLHPFPINKKLRAKWAEKLDRPDWKPSKYSRLCTRHFSGFQRIITNDGIKLKKDCIPSILNKASARHQNRDTVQSNKTPVRLFDDMFNAINSGRIKVPPRFLSKDAKLPSILQQSRLKIRGGGYAVQNQINKNLEASMDETAEATTEQNDIVSYYDQSPGSSDESDDDDYEDDDEDDEEDEDDEVVEDNDETLDQINVCHNRPSDDESNHNTIMNNNSSTDVEEQVDDSPSTESRRSSGSSHTLCADEMTENCCQCKNGND